MGRRKNDEDDWGFEDSYNRHSFGGNGRRRFSGGRGAITLLVSAVVIYGLGIWTGVGFTHPSVIKVPVYIPNQGSTGASGTSNSGSTASSSGNTANAGVDSNSSLITNLYQKVQNSIFTLTAVSGGNSKSAEEDVGTGFLIDNQGDIATNAHVVNGQSEVTVTLNNNQTLQGHVLDADTLDDLAIVHITPPPNIQPLTLGDSSSMQVGQLVVAIGNPFQLTESVSSGIISGLGRSMPMQTGHIMNGLLQTDAVLNPGNSGGPLFNGNGDVIGINTAIESPVEGSVGIGFAIPINRLKTLLPQLLAGKKVGHSWLGISGFDLDPPTAKLMNLPVTSGAYVVYTEPKSPAAAAGIRGDSAATSKNLTTIGPGQLKDDGDIIVACNGDTVTSVEDLTADLDNFQPGQTVKLTVVRQGKRLVLSVTLGAWPASQSSSAG